MVSVMDAKVEQAVQQALGSTRPMLEKLDTVTGILRQNGLAWKTTCKVQEMLVHPQNRGGQMLSVEDVHSKGAKLLQVGIKKDLLSGSVCFAIGHSDDVKKRQLLANQQLAEGHPELLAPVAGNERYLAVGASHTSSFFRAVAAGKTSPASAELIDHQSPALRDILDNGWEWTVISAAAEAAFPDLPRFYSLALNAHAANLKQMNEIEAASQLALGLRNGLSLKKAIEEVRASEPQCKASLDAIGFYASHFGGGENMPLIDFLGKFGSSAAVHIVIAKAPSGRKPAVAM